MAWDVLGYGLPDDYLGPLDFGDSIKDILLFLDHLDVPTAHIVGFSMGGLIALGFNARSKEGVKTLTLSGASASFAQKVREERGEFVPLCKKPYLEEDKESGDTAPIVARTLMSARSTEVHFQYWSTVYRYSIRRVMLG